MRWKKIGKALLFPPLSVLVILLLVATVCLLYSMAFLGTKSAAIGSYVLAAYTLTLWCVKLPRLVRLFKTFQNENRHLIRWRQDARLRVNVSLYGSLMLNTAYATFQLGLGVYHLSFWFVSLAGYYLSLAAMRLFLVRHTRRHAPGEQMKAELRRYRLCGIVFLVMNLALSLMIFFMVYWNRTFHHHPITAIAMAAYTFTSLAFAIVNVVKYRRLNSPVYEASKVISLAAALVSLLTLESTLLTAFGDGTMDLFARRLLLGTSGGAISVFIILLAMYMIVQGTKKLHKYKE